VSATGEKESDAVLIRDGMHASGERGGKIPCLRRNMKDVATRARDDGADAFVWVVT